MLRTALLIGIYSYCILLLGLFHLLDFIPVFVITAFFVFSSFLLIKPGNGLFPSFNKRSFLEKVILILLIASSLVNLIGVLGPELAFDALWYHLTIPKLFADAGRVYFPQEPLFYYALMPKLTEMYYVASLVLANEQLAKLIHFSFGILSAVAVFKLSNLYLSKKMALLAVLIFYTSPVVGWLSTTAYADLSRAFFESLALYFFLLYIKTKDDKNLYKSSLMLGFAICTKVLSLGTIPIFLVGIFMIGKSSILAKFKKSALYLLISITTPLPWFIISFYYTANPFYPLFTHLQLRDFTANLLHPLVFLKTFIETFLFSADPLNPFYLMVIPLILVTMPLLWKKYRFLLLYCLYTYLVWYTTSQAGGARFLTAHVSSYALLGLLALNIIKKSFITNLIVVFTVFLCFISISYRALANVRYLPVVIGSESKQDFLMRELNFGFGDFYDKNQEVKKIVKEEYVLVLNMHNLFYVDFNYVLEEEDARWGGRYILIQNSELPDKFRDANLIYHNPQTHVTLYRL